MLSEFHITIEDFESTLKQCDKSLVTREDIDHIQRHRLSNLGQDIINFSGIFLQAHINATMWVADAESEYNYSISESIEWDKLEAYVLNQKKLSEADLVEAEEFTKKMSKLLRKQKSKARDYSEKAVQELQSSYKAYFFFIRAFHDAAYGVLLNLFGLQAGAYTSMNRCIEREVQPVFERVQEIPGYIDWFRKFKDKRDQVKLGVNFSLCGPQWDVGVGFNRITPDGGVAISGKSDAQFRIGDLISAIGNSSALIDIISSKIQHSNESLSPDTPT